MTDLINFTLSNGLALHAVSDIDAKLEARAMEDNMYYFAGGKLQLPEGLWWMWVPMWAALAEWLLSKLDPVGGSSVWSPSLSSVKL